MAAFFIGLILVKLNMLNDWILIVYILYCFLSFFKLNVKINYKKKQGMI